MAVKRLQALVQSVLKWFFRFILAVFFREVDVIGDENVPKSEPVIFVGNHQNQFVDAVMLYANCPRAVGFIIAEKSMHRMVVGHFARVMDAIPVKRAQDAARKGTGHLVGVITTTAGGVGKEGGGAKVKTIMRGEGTEFTKQLSPKDSLSWKVTSASGHTVEVAYVVKAVLDDRRVELDRPIAEGHWVTATGLSEGSTTGNGEGAGEASVAFRILPHIDHAEMYATVYGQLKRQHCVGIFPEGGSHDRTSLLPFRSGCAVFALGATEHGVRPVVVPFGLTYFHGHRFRSRSHLEFGAPIRLTEELVELYKAEPKRAIKSLMARIEQGVQDVTINCTNYDEMKLVHALRRLYVPSTIVLTTQEYLRLTRRLAVSYGHLKDEPSMRKLRKHVEDYQLLTESFWLIDSQVDTMDTLDKKASWRLLLRRTLRLCFAALLALPGIIINLPILVTAKLFALHGQRKALAGSTVKVAARDVLASYKIISVMVMCPILYSIYIGIFAYKFSLAKAILFFFPGLNLLSQISMSYTREMILTFRAWVPLLLCLSLKRFGRLFHALYQRRCNLQREVRQAIEDAAPKLAQHGLWSPRSQELLQRVKDEENRREMHLVMEDTRQEGLFEFGRRSRLRPPRATIRDALRDYVNIPWDYFALPSLVARDAASTESLDEYLWNREQIDRVTSQECLDNFEEEYRHEMEAMGLDD